MIQDHQPIHLRDLLDVELAREAISNNWILFKDYLTDIEYREQPVRAVETMIAVCVTEILHWHYLEFTVDGNLQLTNRGQALLN